MRGEQAIFNLEIKKKSGLSINPDIHHSKVSSSESFFNLQLKTDSYMLSSFKEYLRKKVAELNHSIRKFHLFLIPLIRALS